MKLTTHLNLALRSGVSGVLSPLPLLDFMARTGKITLSLPCIMCSNAELVLHVTVRIVTTTIYRVKRQTELIFHITF
jgi:hypothetical protein